jgi:hypothetical protein
MRSLRGLGLPFLLLSPGALPVNAQTVWLGAGIGRDVQRFAEDATPNRLDGAATGWIVLGGLLLPQHVAITAEWIDAGEIEDVRTTTVEFGGVPVAIASSFRHRTRAMSALAGYGHRLARVRLAYLAGVALTHVRREFETNAPALVLVSPSIPATPSRTAVSDRFAAAAGGVQAVVSLTDHLSILTGARFQRLRLDPDLSGWSFRSFVGAGWVF